MLVYFNTLDNDKAWRKTVLLRRLAHKLSIVSFTPA